MSVQGKPQESRAHPVEVDNAGPYFPSCDVHSSQRTAVLAALQCAPEQVRQSILEATDKSPSRPLC